MKLLSIFLVFLSLSFNQLLEVIATNGVDTSAASCSSVDFGCLMNDGYVFSIIETWNGGYGYNNEIQTCVENAWNAGMYHVDVYVFMCPQCYGNSDAASVVNTVYNNLNNAGVQYGMLWFDVEQCSGCWDSDLSSNANYLQDAANQAAYLGINYGIYSSEYEWSATVGYYTGLSSRPLWYAHYDGQQNFDDTSDYTFGGWQSPAMKQYNDYGPSSCGSVDVDWYPSSSSPALPPIDPISTTANSASNSFVGAGTLIVWLMVGLVAFFVGY